MMNSINQINFFRYHQRQEEKRHLLFQYVLHIITFILVLIAGFYGHGGILFWAGAMIFSMLLFYQHSIVKYDDLSRVTLAFGTTNGIASLLFSIFVILDLVIRYQ